MKRAIALAVGLAASALAAPSFVQAQDRGDPPCVLDACLDGTVDPGRSLSPVDPGRAGEPHVPPSGTFATRPSVVAPGQFDFYVLALSWSPGFCETTGASQGRSQCEPGGRLGFVVHGLWPQNRQGYPSDCDAGSRAPSRIALDQAKAMYPDEGLARHEWRKHGTCTGLSPVDYFASVRLARAAITIPPDFVSPDTPRRWAPIDIARAFKAANPRLPVGGMAVTCRNDMLSEVRICFGKDLRGFVPCPEVARASCRRPIEVPPVL